MPQAYSAARCRYVINYDDLRAYMSSVPAPSTAIKFYVATALIPQNGVVVHTVAADTPPLPLRRLVRDRRLLI